MADIETVESETLESADTGTEPGTEKPKPELTPEQIRGIKQRQLTKLAKELGVDIAKPEAAEPNKPGFDYGKAAFLEQKGVTNPDDLKWVEEQAKESGKTEYELFQYKWFREELRERKQARESEDALPSGTNRGGASSKDSVDYWVKLGKLPPNDPELATKVLNKRIELEEKRRFSFD